MSGRGCILPCRILSNISELMVGCACVGENQARVIGNHDNVQSGFARKFFVTNLVFFAVAIAKKPQSYRLVFP